jgi:hypothetical protein
MAFSFFADPNSIGPALVERTFIFHERFKPSDKKSLTFNKPDQINTKYTFVIFGGLAVMVTFGDGRPIALRRRLSPGLPLSDVSYVPTIAPIFNKNLTGKYQQTFKAVRLQKSRITVYYP